MSGSIFVTTYAIGNQYGFGAGKWFDLSKYSDLQEFLADATNFAQNELKDSDPELCFADYENIPKDWVSETHLNEKVFEYQDLTKEEREIVDAYLVIGDEDTEIEDILKKVAFYQTFDSDAEFAEHFAINSNIFDEQVLICVDWERYAQDLMQSYTSSEGFYFAA